MQPSYPPWRVPQQPPEAPAGRVMQAEIDPLLEAVLKQQAVSQWGNNRWGQITTLGSVGVRTLGFAQFMC